jgi:opine dehydrogenase
MTVVAVLGAGAGGLSSAVELALAGHEVRLWNRSAQTIEPYVDNGVVTFRGVLGAGTVQVSAVSTDLRLTLRGAAAVVVSLPALAHAALFDDLAEQDCHVPVVLNPGHTGGALHARTVFARRKKSLPPVAELSTLTYVARTGVDGCVAITCRAGHVRCACLPGGDAATDVASNLFPGVTASRDVLGTSLSNINMVLHPPGAILAVAWVEAPRQDFKFYVDAMTPGVIRVMERLDAERRAVAERFGHNLPSLIEEMALVGTVDEAAAARGDTREAITGGAANRAIAAPDSLHHRYYEEDLPFALTPFTALADVAGVPVPVARSLLTIGGALLERDLVSTGLRSADLGIEGYGIEELLKIVRGVHG